MFHVGHGVLREMWIGPDNHSYRTLIMSKVSSLSTPEHSVHFWQ